MDKEWLERRLYKRVGTIYGVQEKTEDVDTIAAQHEQDVASLVAVRDMYAIEIEGLQAQVAEMGGALEYTLVRLKPLLELMREDRRPTEWVEKIEKALTGAPKVLYRVLGKLANLDPELIPVVHICQGQPIDLCTTHLFHYGKISGSPVAVLVLECPPKGEQGYKRARGVISLGGKRPEDVIAEMRGRPTESEQDFPGIEAFDVEPDGRIKRVESEQEEATDEAN